MGRYPSGNDTDWLQYSFENKEANYIFSGYPIDLNLKVYREFEAGIIFGGVVSNSGFHQITLDYNFGKNPVLHNCYCPGFNSFQTPIDNLL